MIPKNITESNIIKAIENIDLNGIQYPLTKSKKYDLVYNGKTYPPKLVISLANEYANGEYLTHEKFITIEAQKYLKNLSPNFSIKEKGPNVIEKLIERYKAIVKEKGLKDELYKWQLVKKVKGRPNLDAPDFVKEIKDTNTQDNNLVYQMAKATAKRIASFRPEEYRICFRNLFNEEIPLSKRINDFQNETLKLYQLSEGKHSSHHDERTISAYLTFHNPERYTFYKSSYYYEYCNLLEIKPKDAGYKYVHYLELIHDLINNYILEDNELLSLVDNELKKDNCYSDKNRMILAQDILYQTLIIDTQQTNYWVFQGNPAFFDVISAINNNALKTWTVKAHKDKIKLGDKVILWMTGNKSGCYALCEVMSDVYNGIDEEDEVNFYLKDEINELSDRVKIKITHNLANNPIFKTQIEKVDELQYLKGGNQGTNFKATQEEYNAILKLIDNMTYYNELIKFLHQAKTTDLKTSTYLSNYLGVKVKVSFGQGGQANVPWISFLRDGQTTQNGIYPVYLFYKDLDLLILAYGISETKTPEVNWSLANPKTIINYFSENNLGFPFRYGKSYIFKAYKTNELAQKETLDNDLFEIVQYYKSIQLEKINQEPITKSINFSYKTFIQSIFDSNLFFVNNLIIRFTSSLLTKPFVILTGLSGSGKTKLAQAFAMWLCENDTQYKIVPVGADWTNREPLLGFPNGLDAKQYVAPDSGALELIINASKEENQDKPYFLILDEMNLSHVERYFADFLSVMESKEMVKLYSGAVRESSDGTKIPTEIAWPKNLFIVGTVNIDETTYMFSPKVLDRANVIEFRVTDTEMESYLASAKELKMESLKAGGASMAADFVRMAKADLIQIAEEKEINDALLAFFKELKKSGAEFGYRSASEILRFAGVAKTIEPAWIVDDVIDAAVMQKLLPKVHGSRNKLSKILPVLGGFCLVNPEKIKDDYLERFDSVDFENDTNIKFKLSFEKICRMYRNAIENGYASYAEA